MFELAGVLDLRQRDAVQKKKKKKGHVANGRTLRESTVIWKARHDFIAHYRVSRRRDNRR